MMESSSLEDPWQCTCTNGEIGLIADTTATHGGSGLGIRPRELLEGSLATCLNMTIRMVAEEEDIDLDDISVTVELDRSYNPEKLWYDLSFDGLEKEEAGKLREAVNESPIYQTLAGTAEIKERNIAVES